MKLNDELQILYIPPGVDPGGDSLGSFTICFQGPAAAPLGSRPHDVVASRCNAHGVDPVAAPFLGHAFKGQWQRHPAPGYTM